MVSKINILLKYTQDREKNKIIEYKYNILKDKNKKLK